MTNRNRIWKGMLLGAAAGGSLTLLNKGTRTVVLKRYKSASRTVKFAVKNPGDINNVIKESADNMGDKIKHAAGEIVYLAGKAKVLMETTPKVAQMLKETKAAFTEKPQFPATENMLPVPAMKNEVAVSDTDITIVKPHINPKQLEVKKMEVSSEINSSLVKKLINRIKEDDLPGLSAQLAYFFLLSLFPLLIVLFTLLPYLPIPHQDIMGTIRSFAPKEALALIDKNLKDVMANRSGGLLSFGIIGTIWSASTGISALVRAFNKSYDVEENRSFIKEKGMSILLTIGMVFVFIVALVLPVLGKGIGMFLFSLLGLSSQFLLIWGALRWVVSGLILFLIFTGLYWIAPNLKMKCKSAIPGAIFATFGWILTSFAFSLYVGYFGHYANTYGSIGAIIVLMTWLYLSAFIIIIGGEINAFYSERHKQNC